MTKLELKPHPSLVECPETKKMVAAFPDLRSIFVDGRCVGYTGDAPFHRVSLIDWEVSQDTMLVTRIKLAVNEEFGITPDKVSSVPEPVAIDTDDDDEDNN